MSLRKLRMFYGNNVKSDQRSTNHRAVHSTKGLQSESLLCCDCGSLRCLPFRTLTLPDERWKRCCAINLHFVGNSVSYPSLPEWSSSIGAPWFKDRTAMAQGYPLHDFGRGGAEYLQCSPLDMPLGTILLWAIAWLPGLLSTKYSLVQLCPFSTIAEEQHQYFPWSGRRVLNLI